MPLADIRPEHAGHKMRIAGLCVRAGDSTKERSEADDCCATLSSITAVDTEANLAVVAYNKAALLIDYSLCLSEEAIQDRQGGDSATHRFTASYSAQHRTALPTLKSKVMIIGDLVSREGESAEEVVADHGALPGVILQATLFKECLDLDLQVWEQAARVESRAVWDEYEKRRQR